MRANITFTLPDDGIFDLKYESLVTSPKVKLMQIFSMLKWADWEDGLLKFHQNEHVVLTTSIDQVRKPLNRNGIGRWKTYASELDTLAAKLKKYAKEILGLESTKEEWLNGSLYWKRENIRKGRRKNTEIKSEL